MESYQVTGSDFSPIFLDLLRGKFPNVELIELNAITLDTNKVFDGIFTNKVLHHLTDEELKTSIINQNRILDNHGVICHSFWKGNDTENTQGLLFNRHTNEEIVEFFSEFFEIILLEIYTEMKEDDSILLIARKKK